MGRWPPTESAAPEIAKRVGVSRPTVIDWRARYEHSGITGLDDERRSSRPRQVDHDAIITATLTPPPSSASRAV